MTCKNCGHPVDASFCPNCGQSTRVEKLTMASLINQLSEGVFQLNKGFFFTLVELFKRPGNSIREFLLGKRKNHFKPIGYAFLVSTVYFFLARALGTETILNELISGIAEGGSSEELVDQMNWFADRYAYVILLFLPLYALASYLAFRKTGYNYVEHIVLNAYIIGQQGLIYSGYAILSYLTGDTNVLALVMVILSISYQVVVFWQFFKGEGNLSLAFRSIATYVLSLIFLSFIILYIMWQFGILE